jgi:hypothetical protein
MVAQLPRKAVRQTRVAPHAGAKAPVQALDVRRGDVLRVRAPTTTIARMEPWAGKRRTSDFSKKRELRCHQALRTLQIEVGSPHWTTSATGSSVRQPDVNCLLNRCAPRKSSQFLANPTVSSTFSISRVGSCWLELPLFLAPQRQSRGQRRHGFSGRVAFILTWTGRQIDASVVCAMSSLHPDVCRSQRSIQMSRVSLSLRMAVRPVNFQVGRPTAGHRLAQGETAKERTQCRGGAATMVCRHPSARGRSANPD